MYCLVIIFLSCVAFTYSTTPIFFCYPALTLCDTITFLATLPYPTLHPILSFSTPSLSSFLSLPQCSTEGDCLNLHADSPNQIQMEGRVIQAGLTQPKQHHTTAPSHTHRHTHTTRRKRNKYTDYLAVQASLLTNH